MSTARQVIKLRRDTAAAWTAANPVLADGEPGYETDTNKLKIGNGSTAWVTLPYTGGVGALASLSDVLTASKVDGSVLVYNQGQDKFVADSATTKLTLTDGGNF